MQNLSLVLILSATCLCWTRPSLALSVRQKLIELGTSVNQIRGTINATSRDLHEKLIEMTEVMNVNVRQLTEAMNGKVMQITEKMDRITGTLDDVITATGCQRNFTLFESSCYYFSEPLASHGGDQSYAQAQCDIHGSNLVAIESKKEADFIINHTVAGAYWTSAHKHGSAWRWDSTGVNMADLYVPWNTGQPDTASYLCAYVQGSNGKLYDASCSQVGWRYICETKLPACA